MSNFTVATHCLLVLLNQWFPSPIHVVHGDVSWGGWGRRMDRGCTVHWILERLSGRKAWRGYWWWVLSDYRGKRSVLATSSCYIGGLPGCCCCCCIGQGTQVGKRLWRVSVSWPMDRDRHCMVACWITGNRRRWGRRRNSSVCGWWWPSSWSFAGTGGALSLALLHSGRGRWRRVCFLGTKAWSAREEASKSDWSIGIDKGCG